MCSVEVLSVFRVVGVDLIVVNILVVVEGVLFIEVEAVCATVVVVVICVVLVALGVDVIVLSVVVVEGAVCLVVGELARKVFIGEVNVEEGNVDNGVVLVETVELGLLDDAFVVVVVENAVGVVVNASVVMVVGEDDVDDDVDTVVSIAVDTWVEIGARDDTTVVLTVVVG